MSVLVSTDKAVVSWAIVSSLYSERDGTINIIHYMHLLYVTVLQDLWPLSCFLLLLLPIPIEKKNRDCHCD